MEKFVNILPILVMAECFFASIPLAFTGKWGSALYWFAAGLINATVIFGIKRFG
jgi:hypothetical protein